MYQNVFRMNSANFLSMKLSSDDTKIFLELGFIEEYVNVKDIFQPIETLNGFSLFDYIMDK